ncbi:MAG: sodium:solute symporter family protein [Candidatus Kapaibacteriales bacterium]
MNLTSIDKVIILLYFLIIAFFGFFARLKEYKKGARPNVNDFVLAGRKVTLPFFVASLVATWYGNILGIGEFVYRKGLVAWFCFGIVYYVSALAYAFLISSKVRFSISATIPEQIGKAFGEKNRFVSSIIILLITLPAIYVLMVGIFFQMFFKLNLEITIILAAILTFSYITFGGFKTNIVTNSIQFLLMYFGFWVFTYFGLQSVNWDTKFIKSLPNNHLSFFGNESWQYILSWVLISLQTFVDPSFYQRCLSARNIMTAKLGIIISIFLWLVFDLMTLFLGLISKFHFADINPIYAFPMLSDLVLPPFWKGFVIVAMLATIISTLESYSFLSGLIIGKELFSKSPFFSPKNELFKVRLGIIISGILSIFLAIIIPSAIDLIFKTSSIVVPALFYPLIFSYSKKKFLSSKQVMFILISSSLFTLMVFFLKEKILIPHSPLISFIIDFEPMVTGFILSSLTSVLFLVFNKLKRVPLA